MLEAAVAERRCATWPSGWPAWSGRCGSAPADARPALAEAHASWPRSSTDGVAAYERLVAAAAGYVAEDGRPVTDQHPAAAG